MWPTFAGIGLLVLMLGGALLIFYCLQAGRRASRVQMTDIEDPGEDAEKNKMDFMASLASQSTQLSSARPGSRQSTAASKSRYVEKRCDRLIRPRSEEGSSRSRQVRAVLEAEMLNEDFDWARPATDILASREGRFTVEDLCTVYLERRPATSPNLLMEDGEEFGLPAIDMDELKEATAAAIAAAEAEGPKVRDGRFKAPAFAPAPGRRRREDVPYKEVWANTTQPSQPNFLFEVWTSPELVKDWQPKKPRKKKLTRAWSMGSQEFAKVTRGVDTDPVTDRRPYTANSAWFVEGQFLRPATLKARMREQEKPKEKEDVSFQQRAATAAAWMFGRRRPEPEENLEPDPAAQAEKLVNEMRQQLQHSRGEPLQVRRLIFRDLQRQLHPDKNTECEEAAKHAFQKLMEERSSYLRP